MSNMRPAISIITSCFNSTAFLDRLYKSLCRQTYKDFEWVVTDDCSNDGTLELLLSLPSPSSHPMKIFQVPVNSGGSAATYTNILNCRAPIVVKVDHDDELIDNALERIAKDWPLYRSRSSNHIVGVLYRSVQPDTGKRISIPLEKGQEFSWSWFLNSARGSVDGLLALNGETLREYSASSDRLRVNLNGVNLLRMGRSGGWVYGGDEVLMYYHRDNPSSQTNKIRLSENTLYTYCKYLELFDRYYFRNIIRWVRHAAVLSKISIALHGTPLRSLDFLHGFWVRSLVILMMPVGCVLAIRDEGKFEVVSYKKIDKDVLVRLRDIRNPKESVDR